MSETNAYEKLIEHCRTWLFDLPDSEILMPLLEVRFSPEEAEFLSGFPHRTSTIEQISERLGIPSDKLPEIMEPLIRKGLIYPYVGKSTTRYAFTDPIFFLNRMPGWKGEDDEWNRRISPLINRYYTERLGADFMGHPTKGLRAVPIAKTIKDTSLILPYEDVLAFVDKEDFHSVSSCACRHRHNMDTSFPKCSHETETCLHFGDLGRYTVKYGIGRQISKSETNDILSRSADAGRVHAMSNTKSGMDTVCNCCSCCCLMLEKVKSAAPYTRGHQRSNYMVERNVETCKSCGLCVKRCPMGAMEHRVADAQSVQEAENAAHAINKDVSYRQDLCIGCGVCAHKCPTRSLMLIPRGKKEDIPADMMEAAMRILVERKRDMSKIF